MATLLTELVNFTPWLMREFYDLKLNKRLNKVAELCQAQLSRRSGPAVVKPSAMRSDLSHVRIVNGEKPVFRDRKTDDTRNADIVYIGKQHAQFWNAAEHPPFAHPFCWSPFVMFGNWR